MDLDQNFPLGHYRLGQIYTLEGMYSEAIPELEKAVAVSHSSPRAIAELGLAHALNGWFGTSGSCRKVSHLQPLGHLRLVRAALVFKGVC